LLRQETDFVNRQAVDSLQPFQVERIKLKSVAGYRHEDGIIVSGRGIYVQIQESQGLLLLFPVGYAVSVDRL